MKIKTINEEGIIFNNGATLEHYHDQECCEHVYADWQNMQVITKIGENFIDSNKLEFDENITDHIYLAKGVGFILEDKNGIKLMVSCYDIQNGYYSSNLELIYTPKQQIKIDITDCTKYIDG